MTKPVFRRHRRTVAKSPVLGAPYTPPDPYMTDLPAPHQCPESLTPEAERYDNTVHGYGRALEPPITPVLKADGSLEGRLLWVIGNGEYGSYVRFCPWCGLNLETVTV